MAWHDGVRTGIATPVAAGLLALAVGFGGFGTWAMVAPLQSSVIAPGKVVAVGRNKIVQHLEGGIVERVLVEEGQTVAAGEPVLLLDGAAAKAQLERVAIQIAALEAIEARAVAERDGADQISFRPTPSANANPELKRMFEDQQAGFEAARRKYRTELAIFDQQIAALEAVIEGYENQRLETLRQIDLAVEQRESQEALLGEGLTRKSEVLALKRAEAELRGKVSQFMASGAEAQRSIAEIRERIERTKTQRVEDAAARLLDARLRRADLVEQLKSAGDVTRRLVVTAPASGVVMQLTKFNPGAVVGPGQEIMMIVPQDTAMQVEAIIRPQDVESVWVGQDAWLTFPAQHTSGSPPVAARVTYLSPDRIEDQQTGDAYYVARLEILPASAETVDPAMIGPGQAAEVYITTGERTFADYLLEPFMRTLQRSVRES